MYVRERAFFRDSIEVAEKHTGRYGAPGMERAKRKKATPEQMARQNQWRRERDIRWLIKTNFGEHDYWTTLTYRKSERPEDMGQAKRHFQKFIGKLRKQYKSRGQPLRYVATIEVGSRGGFHVHMVANRIADGDRLITDLWEHGHANITLLYKEGGFRELASYIAKRPEGGNAKSWLSRSRNLDMPEVKKEVMKRKTFRKEPFVPKGYCLDKDSVFSGTNPVTGHPYRYYTVMRC